MKNALLLVVLAVIALVVLVALARRGARGGVGSTDSAEWPFYAKRPLSVPEQVLYHRLVRTLPDHIVLAQVQVSRVLGVKKGFDFNTWNNRINRLSYDFVACGKDGTVLAAIELDDKSHETASRADTDRKKDRATAAAGLPLLRWQVKALPDEAAIRAEFAHRSPAHAAAWFSAAQPVPGAPAGR